MELLPPRRSGPHNWAVSQRRRGSGLDAAGTRPGAERAEAPSTGGRPPARLVFNADAGVVLAAAIGRSRTQLGVCNLAGEVLTMADFDQEIGIGPNDLMPDIAKRLEALLDDTGRRVDDVLGVRRHLRNPIPPRTSHRSGRAVRRSSSSRWRWGRDRQTALERQARLSGICL